MIYEETQPYLIQWFGTSPDNPDFMIYIFYPDTPLSFIYDLLGNRVRTILHRKRVTVVYVHPL